MGRGLKSPRSRRRPSLRTLRDWEADVAAFDEIFTEILTVSDALSDGLVAQFPEKFEG